MEHTVKCSLPHLIHIKYEKQGNITLNRYWWARPTIFIQLYISHKSISLYTFLLKCILFYNKYVYYIMDTLQSLNMNY